MSFAIYKSGPSNGAINLKNALRATMLKSQGSRYTPRHNKLLINWGSSGDEAVRLAGITHADNLLNDPRCVGVAAHKLRCLEVLSLAGVPCVPWYTTLSDALAHTNDGRGRIYARTRLTGNSGEGIQLIMSASDPQFEESAPFPIKTSEGATEDNELRQCRLFTVGITGRRHEWRVHVVNGKPVLTQLKLRREGFEELEGYTSLVRNVESGWVYSVNFERDSYDNVEEVEALAVQAIEAIGLDFGAVDIVQRRGRNTDAFVLEVNTAPGLDESGSALQAYASAFREYHDEVVA